MVREKSSWGREQAVIGAAALAALLAWMAYEIKMYLSTGAGPGAIIYILGFLGLFVWRYAFRYTYIASADEVAVVTEGLGLERRFAVNASEVEGFAVKYNKKALKGRGINKFIYRYSALDPNPVRILLFRRDGKLQGVLFKGSEEFFRSLQELMPGKNINLAEDGR
ncbi:hypothetical protein [Anaeroselena agilis]|uniref:PH domain-containing protein n=1 Tax=Anaeroselena agilis TaxID=3063788 RepID=A0ABU3P115_9FIRM|nr:hypothetical protein [Selenomonadales bacterium 4137-cl]